MNCTIVQRRLLALENPRRTPAELQAHLSDCPTCRDWLRHLVELERRVPLLPVPASTAKDAFLARVLAGEVVPRRESPPVHRPVAGRVDGRRRDRGMRKAALAVALAAGLLLFVVIVAAMQNQRLPGPRRQAAPDPLLADLLDRDLRLARAPARSERFLELAALAEELRRQAEPLAAAGSAEDLHALSGWYRQVVREGVVTLGPDASAPDRRKVADRLDLARDESERLARESPEDCATDLREMATTAGNASLSLQPDARSFRPGREAPPTLSLVGGRGPFPACVPAVVLASVARAQPPAASLTRAEQAKHFHQNRGLIEKLVSGGLCLAGEENALKRAACCNGIAQTMADEIRHAAEEREGSRVAELGKHLQSLLKRGVAENLTTARIHIPSGSAEEKELEKVRTETEGFIKPLQDVIGAADADDIRSAHSAVSDGLESVKKAVIRAKS
jgi:hypothetical protein